MNAFVLEENYMNKVLAVSIYRRGYGVAMPGRFLGFLMLLLMASCASWSTEPASEAATRVYHYEHWDVFTDLALTGNQLAVFKVQAGLEADLMRKMALEMAFSETAFVFPADEAGLDARVRIFSPTRELSFAGHPTIGTTFALASSGLFASGTPEIILGEGIGPVVVELEWEGDQLRFAWMHQQPPVFGPAIRELDAIAAALGVAPAQLTSLSLPVQEVSCGSPYIMVPLASRAAVDQARLDNVALGKVFDSEGVNRHSLLVFSLETAGDGATVYSRMLRFDGTEDPATGGASGPLGSYLVKHGLVSSARSASIVSRQGVQMGRPSSIHIRIVSNGDEIVDVLVGGSAVHVGGGRLLLPEG